MQSTPKRSINHCPEIHRNRVIYGSSAILLPVLADLSIDWQGFRGHVQRTVDAGLVPAVNMDTGYASLISPEQRVQVLRETQALSGDLGFIAGVYVGDEPTADFDYDAYRVGIDEVLECDGIPIIFQSYGLTRQSDDEIVTSYQRIGSHAGEFLAFELGEVFAPFGRIYSLDVYSGLMGVKECIGAKHSSLRRELEWQRITIRDQQRPDFRVMTGNDLAIDMVMYGSDYLLGLSTFSPASFARRDAMWASGDADFYELNDLLQYLGCFAFRDPVPAYKHNAAQFLHARGWIQTPMTYPGSPHRPQSDVPILKDILKRLETF